MGVDEDFWVFGYGSLMWNPGFEHHMKSRARLIGAHRALCVISHIYRGTPERPGLVFGLEQGGSCHGMAFAVRPEDRDRVHAYLTEREQVTLVYREAYRRVRLEDGRVVTALTYVVDRTHPQYAGRMPDERRLEMVRQGIGKAGPNTDYVISTLQHLRDIGLDDPALARLVEALTAR